MDTRRSSSGRSRTGKQSVSRMKPRMISKSRAICGSSSHTWVSLPSSVLNTAPALRDTLPEIGKVANRSIDSDRLCHGIRRQTVLDPVRWLRRSMGSDPGSEAYQQRSYHGLLRHLLEAICAITKICQRYTTSYCACVINGLQVGRVRIIAGRDMSLRNV